MTRPLDDQSLQSGVASVSAAVTRCHSLPATTTSTSCILEHLRYSSAGEEGRGFRRLGPSSGVGRGCFVGGGRVRAPGAAATVPPCSCSNRFRGGGPLCPASVVYAAAAPARQHRRVDDSPEAMFRLPAHRGRDAVPAAILRSVLRRRVALLPGWRPRRALSRQLCRTIRAYPTNRHYLYYSGANCPLLLLLLPPPRRRFRCRRPPPAPLPPSPRGHRPGAAVPPAPAPYACLSSAAVPPGVPGAHPDHPRRTGSRSRLPVPWLSALPCTRRRLARAGRNKGELTAWSVKPTFTCRRPDGSLQTSP